jgi:hypothetical protein
MLRILAPSVRRIKFQQGMRRVSNRIQHATSKHDGAARMVRMIPNNCRYGSMRLESRTQDEWNQCEIEWSWQEWCSGVVRRLAGPLQSSGVQEHEVSCGSWAVMS